MPVRLVTIADITDGRVQMKLLANVSDLQDFDFGAALVRLPYVPGLEEARRLALDCGFGIDGTLVAIDRAHASSTEHFEDRYYSPFGVQACRTIVVNLRRR